MSLAARARNEAERPNYRPTYWELGNQDVYRYYEATDNHIVQSRQGSNFITRKIAQMQAAVRMLEISLLPINWDERGSEKPGPIAVSKASEIANTLILNDLVPDAILPSAEGGVVICFVKSDRYADVECLNTGEVLAADYYQDDTPQAWSVEQTAAGMEYTVDRISSLLAE